MATDLADYSQAVNVVGGSVSITGTATVSISGTPTVIVSGTPTVNIGNTPAVTISSGSVTATISGTPNINITSQSVMVNVNQPQTKLADISLVNGTNNVTTGVVPAGTHALSLGFKTSGMLASVFQVKGHTTGLVYSPADAQGLIPLLPLGSVVIVPVDSAQDTQFDLAISSSGAGVLSVTAILDTESVWVQNTRLTPLYIQGTGDQLAALTAQAVIPQHYDGSGTSAPAQGVQATFSLAATPGKFWVAHFIAGGFTENVAQSFGMFLQILDGAAVILNQFIGAAALAGNTPNGQVNDLALKGTLNTAMVFRLSAANGNLTEGVSGGAYLAIV